MARKQVLVQLDDGQVAALDRLARTAADSRSELIRRAIDLYLEAAGEAPAAPRMVCWLCRIEPRSAW